MRTSVRLMVECARQLTREALAEFQSRTATDMRPYFLSQTRHINESRSHVQQMEDSGSQRRVRETAGPDASDQHVIDMMLRRGGVRTLDSETLITNVQNHVSEALEHGYEYNTTLEESDAFLRKRVQSRIKLVIMYADLVGSTEMSLTNPEDRVAMIISTFAQEMARVIMLYGGRVLKFVGDAVIAYFVADENSLRASDNAVSCAKAMNDVIRRGINPILGKRGYPTLTIKIGIDYGTNMIIRYGADVTKSYVDIIGSPMNIAAKIQSRAEPNKILIGSDVYTRLHPSIQESFVEVVWKNKEWKYKATNTDEVYKVYEYSG